MERLLLGRGMLGLSLDLGVSCGLTLDPWVEVLCQLACSLYLFSDHITVNIITIILVYLIEVGRMFASSCILPLVRMRAL